MVTSAHIHSGAWFDPDGQGRFFAQLGRTLTVSLVLHIVVLLVVAGLRLVPRGERPLASVEVALVSLPEPVQRVDVPKPVRHAEQRPVPVPVPPVKAMEPVVTPAPAPPIKAVEPTVVPVPAPSVKTMAPSPIAAPPRTKIAKDILRDLQLPPEAPKIGELTPAQAIAQPQPKTRGQVKIPELPRIPDVVPDQAIKKPKESSLSEELNRELEEELKKVKEFVPAAKLEIPKDEPPPSLLRPEAPVVEVKAPQTQLKTSGSTGTNPYWARVEAIIKKNWEPPPIDVGGQTYSVVVKFRFYRNGKVKDVGIQKTSGNTYFDMAGERAVLKPRVFPPFPAEMTEEYQDVEMTFLVGEASG